MWHLTVYSLPIVDQGAMIMEADILEALGGSSVFGKRRRIDLMEEVERGLPTKSYKVIAAALGLRPGEEDKLLGVSARTRARWAGKARIDPATSDRIMRLARIFALATDVLGSREAAVEWLREPTEYLGGRSPLEALATDVGAEKVTNMLYQMEYGVFA